jgi:hypothetical protein
MKKTQISACIALLLAGAAAPALADDEVLTIHGFGNQDYWRSGTTSFSGSGPHGTWQNDDLGLIFRGTVNDKTHVYAQLQADATDPVQVLWMFVDYQVNDDLRIKAGKVKFPLGIYNEYVDTRGLQLSALTPLMYYDAFDLTYDAYMGAGIDYDYSIGKSGKLTFQPFIGNIPTSPAPFTAPAFTGPTNTLEAPSTDRNLYGMRVTWETPIDGLRLLGVGYNTKIDATTASGQALGISGNESRYVLSVDYVTETLDIKSEYSHHRYPDMAGFPVVASRSWYLQAGYHYGAWTPYTRYDSVVTDTAYSSDPSFYQRDFVIGIDRLIANNLHLRGENHFNHGYAMPVVNGDIAAGTGKVDWSLLAVQINYMF